MYLRSDDSTTYLKNYTKCYIQSPLETRSVVQSFLKLQTRLTNSTSRVLSRITCPLDTNPTSPLPDPNVATVHIPINLHQDDPTYSYPIELSTPTELLFSSPRIQSEDTNIGANEHGIDEIVGHPSPRHMPPSLVLNVYECHNLLHKKWKRSYVMFVSFIPKNLLEIYQNFSALSCEF